VLAARQHALVTTVELAAEQMLHVAQHLPGIRLDDRMDVVAHDRARVRVAWTVPDQNSA
jgi:hypothetical protein